MAKVPNGIKTLPKISIPWVGCTNVTDDRQTDGRQHIANVNLSSRSLKTCTLTSRSRLESYKRLVSVSSRNFNVSSRSRFGWWCQRLGLVSVSGGERLGLVSVSSFCVSCPSLVRAFHAQATAVGKARLPSVVRGVDGTTSDVGWSTPKTPTWTYVGSQVEGLTEMAPCR